MHREEGIAGIPQDEPRWRRAACAHDPVSIGQCGQWTHAQMAESVQLCNEVRADRVKALVLTGERPVLALAERLV
jgi:hypothetical protein